MTVHPLPHATISRPIPAEDRRLVYIVGHGYGVPQDMQMLGGTVTGLVVLTDDGARMTVTPSQIRELPGAVQSVPDALPGNVVRMTRRASGVRV